MSNQVGKKGGDSRTPSFRKAACPLFFLALAFSACPPPPCDPQIDDCPEDAGPPPPDFCNSIMEAQTNPMCAIKLCSPPNTDPDAGLLWFINPVDGGTGDQDWFSAQLGTLNPRSLLHVTAGYAAPATPVDLSVRVLQPDGMMAIANAVDDHGQKPPGPIDIIVPYTQSDAKILILVSDKGNRIPPVFDLRNPYTLTVCTQDNPDMNEPNDTTPTVIANSGGMGTATGVLATANDVDLFTFDPGSLSGGRKILYLHITSPMDLLPPAAYRLNYTLFDPDMVPISEGTNSSGFVKVDLATARLLKKAGAYTLRIQGFKTTPTDVIPGDLRQVYTVNLQVLPDTDMTEPNDNMAESGTHATAMALGSSHTFTGSLSYVPDPEWIALDIPSMGTPATLHAKLTVASGGGRFAALPGPLDRQLRIIAPVKGATLADSLTACQMSADQSTGCPKGYSPQDQTQATLVGEICQDFVDAGAAQCLWSERNEHSQFEPLRNMETVVPVPAANATRYWIVVGDDGNNYADDVQWTLQVWLDADGDEATHGPTQVDMQSINSTVSGNISHGYARLIEYDPNTGPRGIRGPNDYDAVPTDFDNYAFSLPGSESSWSLSWTLDHGDAGTPSAKLALDLQLCTSSNQCDDLGTLFYQDGPLQPWWGRALTDRGQLYGLTMNATSDTVTLLPNACMCFESRFTTLKVKVNATDRDFYYPLNYHLTQSSGGYPPPSFTVDGGTVSCPAPALPDGGGGTGCKLE